MFSVQSVLFLVCLAAVCSGVHERVLVRGELRGGFASNLALPRVVLGIVLLAGLTLAV
jgi:hypothetical protein